ncbi:MAG TPA: HDIG domain-containing protein [Gemmatimonadaceae bacterium]
MPTRMARWWEARPAWLRGPVGFHAARGAVGLTLAVVTYLLFPAAPAVDFPVLEVGAVSPTNVIAPFEYRVPKAEAELAREREDAARAVVPIFEYVPAAVDTVRSDLAALMRAAAAAASAAGQANEADRAAAVQTALRQLSLPLTAEEAAYLAQAPRRQSVQQALTSVVNRWLVQGVTAPGALDSVRGNLVLRREGEERTITADSVLTFPALLTRARLVHPDPSSSVADGVYLKLLGRIFRPTVRFDRVGTERVRAQLRQAIATDKYTVRQGEKIVGAHEVVGREDYEKMRALRDQLQLAPGGGAAVGRVAGAILLNLLIVSILGLMLLLFRPPLYASIRAVLVIGAAIVLVLGSAALIAHQSPEGILVELIPVAFSAVLFSVLFDSRFSLIAAMVLALLIGAQGIFRGTNALYFTTLGGVAAAFSTRVIRRRNQTYFSVATIAAAYVLTSVAVGFTLDREPAAILWSAAWGVLNAIVSVSLAMILLPPAEELTGIDTYLKLLEWSDLNRPLMQRLSLEAPGTYAHTIAMANLVEAAANAIGANGLLARVGTYYHDIGKLKKPQYFVENQPKGRNPHDKLKPTQSAAIIRHHIRDGLELADEYRLPRAVRAFITEHHGLGQITYFMEKARERDGGVPNTAEFTYPGPIPQSAETAICMLADGVEASMRVLSDPTPEKIRELVDHIVRQRIDQGQLRDAPLTLRQLEIIKREFARVLSGMYHARIDYPAASGGVSSEFASV